MGRLTLIPNRFFLSPTFLVQVIFKLYGEFAILGLKDYGTYYPDITRRIPVMVGFNVPCFKMVDIVSLDLNIMDKILVYGQPTGRG